MFADVNKFKNMARTNDYFKLTILSIGIRSFFFFFSLKNCLSRSFIALINHFEYLFISTDCN